MWQRWTCFSNPNVIMRSLDGSHYRDLEEIIRSCSRTGGFYDHRCDFSAQVSARPINIPTSSSSSVQNLIQFMRIQSQHHREDTELLHFFLQFKFRLNSKKIPLSHKSRVSLYLTSATARYWSVLNFSGNLCVPLISSGGFIWKWNMFIWVLDCNKVNTAFCKDALFEMESCLYQHV